MMKKPIFFVFLLAGAAILYELLSAAYISSHTGLLIISRSDPAARLSVAENGHNIVNLGTGARRLRLAPGNYDIIATKDKQQSILNIKVDKAHSYQRTISLQPPDQDPKAQYNNEANALISKYLPFTERHSTYRVSYIYQIVGRTSQPVIVITAPTKEGQQAAVKWIESLGYNTSHLDIRLDTAPLY